MTTRRPTREDLATLRGLPGVKAASLFSNIPLSGGGSSNGFQAKPGEVGAQGNGAGQQLRRRRAGDRGARRQADRGPAVRGAARSCRRRKPTRCRRRRSSRRLSRRKCSRRTRTRSARPSTTGSAEPIVDRRHHRAHARCLGRLGQAGQYRAVPAHQERADIDLPRQDRARPARRGDARHRGQARRLEPRPPAALGPAVRLLHQPVLPRRPQHGDLPRQRDERAARDHRARHLRPRDLQRLDAHPPDRHAPRGRRPQARHRAALPCRELDGHDRRHRRRLRRRARHRLLDLGQVRAAAPRPVLPRRRRARDLADRPRRRPAAGAPGLGHLARPWQAGRFRLAWSFQPLRQTRHPN